MGKKGPVFEITLRNVHCLPVDAILLPGIFLLPGVFYLPPGVFCLLPGSELALNIT